MTLEKTSCACLIRDDGCHIDCYLIYLNITDDAMGFLLNMSVIFLAAYTIYNQGVKSNQFKFLPMSLTCFFLIQHTYDVKMRSMNSTCPSDHPFWLCHDFLVDFCPDPFLYPCSSNSYALGLYLYHLVGLYDCRVLEACQFPGLADLYSNGRYNYCNSRYYIKSSHQNC